MGPISARNACYVMVDAVLTSALVTVGQRTLHNSLQ